MARSSLPPVNRKRKAKLNERNFGDYADDFIRELPCCICEHPKPSDPAHVRARGMGGAKGDKWDLVPLCRRCHRLFDTQPWKLEGLFPHVGDVREHLREWANRLRTIWTEHVEEGE